MELLLNMTIAGTVTAIIILLIKMAFKNKLTPKWHFYIWIILAVRLTIPGLPESDISLLNALPTVQDISVVERQSADHQTANPQPEDQQLKSSSVNYIEGNFTIKMPFSGAEIEKAVSITKDKAEVIIIVWASVMVLIAIYLLGVYIIFSKRMRKLPVCSDPETIELFEECKSEVGIYNKTISLRTGGITPMLLGIMKPVILIPEGYTDKELRQILIHELCHYKHKDVFINIICCMTLCIYWFNPVMWFCFYVIRRDLEMLCDLQVIEITGDRKEYATVLLKTALRKSQFVFASTSMQNGEKEVTKRIKYIAYFKKPKIWISTIAVVLAVFVGLVCLTDAAYSDTANIDAGGGYFYKIPESWVSNTTDDTIFYNKNGEVIGGISIISVDIDHNNEAVTIENIPLPTPNHSEILQRTVFEGNVPYTMVLINLNHDTETAAQIAERISKGDNSPAKKINQNHIFIWPDENFNQVYSIWANSSEVTERKLLEIAKTFQENPYPKGYQPETNFQEDWDKTANLLLEKYFKNYAAAEMSRSSDIRGFEINGLVKYEDHDASWSVIYPNIAVFKVDYTLDIAYPDKYSFAGGGFQIGEGNRTKIYQDELAVFQVGQNKKAKFLGFVWPQNREEMGEAMAILNTISYTSLQERAQALFEYKTPYIGASSTVGGLIKNMPLAEYFTGMELQTKEEPYRLTVNYDLTGVGSTIFVSDKDRAFTDSRGWDLSPYLYARLYKNSAILLSLIDNASMVSLKIQGISETGVPYTYIYNLDRMILNDQFNHDTRLFTTSEEKFSEFLNVIEQSLTYDKVMKRGLTL